MAGLKGRGLSRSGDISKRQDSWLLILDSYVFFFNGAGVKEYVSLNSVVSGDGAQAIRLAAHYVKELSQPHPGCSLPGLPSFCLVLRTGLQTSHMPDSSSKSHAKLSFCVVL